MKRLSFLLVVLIIFTGRNVFAQMETRVVNGLTWYTDVQKAQQVSGSTHKPIFAFFTGSDWCGWCHKLEHDVFSKPEFIKWAKDKVILLELDFPRRKQLAPELARQNNELQQVFQVQGYPTIWMFFLNKDAKTGKMNITGLGSLGYPQNAERGKEEVQFLADANKILKNK